MSAVRRTPMSVKFDLREQWVPSVCHGISVRWDKAIALVWHRGTRAFGEPLSASAGRLAFKVSIANKTGHSEGSQEFGYCVKDSSPSGGCPQVLEKMERETGLEPA
jgi:hypothetical protein